MSAENVATLAVDVTFFDQSIVIAWLEELQLAFDVGDNGPSMRSVCGLEAKVKEGFGGGEDLLLRFLLALDLVRAQKNCVIVRMVWGEGFGDGLSI